MCACGFHSAATSAAGHRLAGQGLSHALNCNTVELERRQSPISGYAELHVSSRRNGVAPFDHCSTGSRRPVRTDSGRRLRPWRPAPGERDRHRTGRGSQHRAGSGAHPGAQRPGAIRGEPRARSSSPHPENVEALYTARERLETAASPGSHPQPTHGDQRSLRQARRGGRFTRREPDRRAGPGVPLRDRGAAGQLAAR